jgi:hypothetical protein
MTQHGHQDTQQSTANMAYGLAMPLSLRPQCRIHAVAVRVALHGDSGHVIQRMAQAGVPTAPHHHHAAFATVLRDWGDPAMRAQPLLVSFGQGLRRFRKEPGRHFPSDPRQRQHNRHIRWPLTVTRFLSQGVQQGADLLATGLQLLGQHT